MFDAVFLKEPTQEQAAAFYGLLAKEPGQVKQSDLAAAKEALDQMDERGADDKAYRDSCVALSLFVLYGGGTERFDWEKYGEAFSKLFPERMEDVEVVVGCAQFVAGLKTVLYQELPEKYENLKTVKGSMGSWELIYLMAKRACLDVMLRMQDFALVQGCVRELSGEMLSMDEGIRESVTALRNEFGEFRGGEAR